MTASPAAADAARLRRRFDTAGGFTVGIEEEIMVLDAGTLDLAPRTEELLRRLDGDGRFTSELPASQIEIVTRPHARADDAVTELAASRRDLSAAAGSDIALAVAGAHPFAAPLGALSESARYATVRDQYRSVARRQLVAGLQVHVAVGGAHRSLWVYNALRCLLPEILALAANSPFHDGADTGLASARAGIAAQLPRQGIPPPLGSFEELAAELDWGARAGLVPDPGRWWWELRPHVVHGTLELRVPDAQTTVTQAGGIIALVQALCARLAERCDAGEAVPDPPAWRIAENRWLAMRDGVEGELADLETGERRATRDRLHELLEEVTPCARRLGCADLLSDAAALVERNGAMSQREVAARHGLHGLVGWLRDRLIGGP